MTRRRAWLIGLLVAAWGALALAQTTQHPTKVEIKPKTADRTTDALRIWGGLKAGPTGSAVIINADGTLNVSGTLPTCAAGQILKYNGTNWVCDTDLSGSTGAFSDGTAAAPGITFTADADTGLFRAGTNLLAFATGGAERWRMTSIGLGSGGVTPSQQLHLYRPASSTGLRLERGDAETWDLLASTDLTLTHVESGVTPLTIQATTGRVGLGVPNPTVALDVAGGITLSGNLAVGGYVANNSLIPQYPDTLDLGSFARPWRGIHSSSLYTTVFAEATAQLFGGYSIVGFNAGSLKSEVNAGPTQTLTFDKAPQGTLALPVWIVLRGYTASGVAATEYLRVVSVVNAPAFQYTVERDITGAHATDPVWPDGTPYLVLGTLGTGRIEMNAWQGIPSLQVLMQEQSAAQAFGGDGVYDPRRQVGVLWLGGLDEAPGVDDGRYGIFIGRNETQFLKYQQTLGTPGTQDNTLIVQGTLRALSGWFGAQQAVIVDGSGLDVGILGRIKGGASTYASGNGFWLGYDGSAYKFRVGRPGGQGLWWDDSTGTLVVNGSITVTGGNAATTSYADGAASTAQTNAISAAASDATTKATNAQNTAISTAASDATTKANTAQSNAISWATTNRADTALVNVLSADVRAKTGWGHANNATLIDGQDIFTGSIFADSIAANTITANKLTITSLSAISADLGTITAGTITGATIRTGTGARAEMNNTSLRSIDSGGNTLVTLDGTGIEVTQPTNGVQSANRGYRFALTSGLFGYKNTATNVSVLRMAVSESTNNIAQITASSTSGAAGGLTATTSGTSVTTTVYASPYGGTGTLLLDATRIQSWFGIYPGYATGTYQADYYLARDATVGGLVTNGDFVTAGLKLTNWANSAATHYVCMSTTFGFVYYAASCGASAARYKDNITPVVTDWSRILAVTPVAFNYKTSPTERNFGVVAEQVETLGLRELLVYNTATRELETVDYAKMALYLIPVVRDQRDRILALERRLAVLESRP